MKYRFLGVEAISVPFEVTDFPLKMPRTFFVPERKQIIGFKRIYYPFVIAHKQCERKNIQSHGYIYIIKNAKTEIHPQRSIKYLDINLKRNC